MLYVEDRCRLCQSHSHALPHFFEETFAANATSSCRLAWTSCYSLFRRLGSLALTVAADNASTPPRGRFSDPPLRFRLHLADSWQRQRRLAL